MEVIGLLPIGGNATRMNGLPKFLLPCINQTSLLQNAIHNFQKHNITRILAGLSDINTFLLKNNTDIEKYTVNTKTMTETVKILLDKVNLSTSLSKNILIMPDTYFKMNNELDKVIQLLDSYNIVVLVWKIQDYQIGHVGQCDIVDNEVIDIIDKCKTCDYQYVWGCIAWTSDMNKYIDPSWQTIGELVKIAIRLNIKIGAIKMDGVYYDCGTYTEYFNMIKECL